MAENKGEQTDGHGASRKVGWTQMHIDEANEPRDTERLMEMGSFKFLKKAS